MYGALNTQRVLFNNVFMWTVCKYREGTIAIKYEYPGAVMSQSDAWSYFETFIWSPKYFLN